MKSAPSTEIHTDMETEQPSSDALGLESLLAEGKAAAEAKAAAATPIHKAQSGTMGDAPRQKRQDAMQPSEPAQSIAPIQSAQKETVTETGLPTAPTTRANTLSDAYYADLAIWLEMTGYHDIDFRNSKLGAYKERRQLELEAKRIAERLEKLRQAEQANADSLRASTAHPLNAQPLAPPPLPSTMPSADTAVKVPVTPMTNGTKRAHSPEPISTEKAPKRNDDSGFRIRGAEEATRPTSARRPASPNPLDRRISYPDTRRRSNEDRNVNNERDPSLERRQQAYYKRDEQVPARSAYDDNRREHQQSREPPRILERKAGYSNVNHRAPPSAPTYRDPPQYRGSAGLELRKGGQYSSSRRY